MISIREDVYKNLKKLKGANESFSEVIERLLANQKKEPLKYFNIAKNLPSEILEEFEEEILEGKKKDALRSNNRFFELWGED
jgi:predicted CopG family antitoxin